MTENRTTEDPKDVDVTDEQADATVSAEVEPKHSIFYRLSHGLTDFNILGRWRLWFALSGAILIIGLVGLLGRGLNMGIDFTGGSVWDLPAGKASVTDVQRVMADLGYQDVQVQEATGGNDDRTLRIEAEATAEPTDETTDALDKAEKGLDDLEVPEGVQDRIDTAAIELGDLSGPFEVDVPEPLVAVQKEIDGLPDLLDAEGADADTVASEAADRILGHVEDLVDLEAAEQRRVGQEVTRELARITGTPEEQITVGTVGPSWGKQISDKARNALVVFLIAITLFITIRFELKMAIATVAALFHDLLVVVGLYAVFGFPVTPNTVVALLTMLGFSIYDGIVVFDRVNENTKLTESGKVTYTEMANASLNQVLMRSLNTSITSLLPILGVLIAGFAMGTSTLEEFGLALFLGLLAGAYSSIFIATPLLAMLKEREPAYREVAQKVAERRARTSGGSAAAAGGGDGEKAGVAGAARLAGVTPRPAKPGKKR